MLNPLKVTSLGNGGGNEPAILCLHGVGGCGHWFRGLANRLQDRFRVLALDLPGTGANSEGHTPFSIERATDVLAQWLAEHETSPVALLGHSMGAIIGLRLAAHPRLQSRRLHSLLSVGGLPAVTPANHKRLSERAVLIRTQGMAGLAWRVAEGNFSKSTLSQRPELAALFGALWESQSAEAYLEGLDSLLAADAGPFIPQATMPCLVLRGAEDGYAPAEESRRFAAALPGPVRFVELEGCAHMPFLEAPEAFAEAISGFLKTER
jgi:pimeloyl-ACP methyl ester carboxylesterase